MDCGSGFKIQSQRCRARRKGNQGIFVELKDSKCEGMVRYNTLQDDYYYLDEENFRVIGQETRQIYRLGDPVKVRIEAVDLIKKQMDFTMVSTKRKLQNRNTNPK